MTEQEFLVEAAKLLALCSESQRGRLATMAQDFGKSDAPASAMDGAPRSHPSFAEMFSRDPDHGKSLHDRFPDLNRLKG